MFNLDILKGEKFTIVVTLNLRHTSLHTNFAKKIDKPKHHINKKMDLKTSLRDVGSSFKIDGQNQKVFLLVVKI